MGKGREVGGVFGVELLQGVRLRYSPGPEYLMGTGIKSGNERRVVCMVYGLRAKVVAISGYNFSTINIVSMYL